MRYIRSRSLFALGIVAILAVTLTGPATAHDQYLWYPSSYNLSRTTSTWRTSGDSFYANANMVWNSTNTPQMQHMAGHGFRFTHDVQDVGADGNGNNNVNATGRYSTQLPSPYYDRDPSSSCFRHSEGEITSESSSFPTSGRQYLSQIEFSHWYCTTGSGGTFWFWDSSGDAVTQTAQISAPGCIICDKWDAAQGLADKEMGQTSYPAVSAPSAAVPAQPLEIEDGAVTSSKARPQLAASSSWAWCRRRWSSMSLPCFTPTRTPPSSSSTSRSRITGAVTRTARTS